jgi:hypothetical protein
VSRVTGFHLLTMPVGPTQHMRCNRLCVCSRGHCEASTAHEATRQQPGLRHVGRTDLPIISAASGVPGHRGQTVSSLRTELGMSEQVGGVAVAQSAAAHDRVSEVQVVVVLWAGVR